MPAAARHKVLMLGLDAADIDVIRASLDRLPNLRSLFARETVRPLTSPADVLTSAVWPTFATGLPPGEHGVYYPMQWDPASMQLRRVADDWIRFEPFWYPLAERGVRVTVLDVPFSLPSRLERGVELQNWGSQECLGPFGGNDAALVRDVLRNFGRHPMGDDIPVKGTAKRVARLCRNLVSGAQRKAQLVRSLMRTTDWDLFVTVFAESHRGGHVLWPEPDVPGSVVPPDALHTVYRALDDAIGIVLEGVDAATTVVVFSVHGMGPNFTQEHFAPAILERVGARLRGESIAAAATPAPTRRSPMRMLREAVPGELQYQIARHLPVGVRDWVVRRAFCGGIDWATTPGFLLPGSCESYVRANVKGRERDGAFARDGVELTRWADELRAALHGLVDAASGRSVVREVVACAQRYPGARSDLLPDQVVLWADVPPSTSLGSPTLGAFHGSLGTGRTGDHRPHGFAVVTGPSTGLDRAPELRDAADFAGFARALLG